MSTKQSRKQFLALGGVAGVSFLLGCQDLSAQQTPAATNATEDHPNVAIIKRYYDAYGKGDLATVRQIFAPNIIWRIPGHHPLAGTKQGVDEVLAFFDQLAKAKFKAEVVYLGGNDSYVVDVHRGWSNLAKNNVDQLWALLFRIQNNRIVEATNFPGDQHAADAFFWQVYKLKPLPDRLTT